jgi:hypothetical protein
MSQPPQPPTVKVTTAFRPFMQRIELLHEDPVHKMVPVLLHGGCARVLIVVECVDEALHGPPILLADTDDRSRELHGSGPASVTASC